MMMPVQISLREGFLARLTTRSVIYGGVLFEPSSRGRDSLELLFNSYRQLSGHINLFTEIRNHIDLKNVQTILNSCGFAYEDHLNFIIDLDITPDMIFKNIGRRTRKNIRRGLKRGNVIIEEAKSNEQIRACYNLVNKSYQAARIPLVDRTFFESAFNLLYPGKLVRFTLAYNNNIPIAASMELMYKDTIHGMYGGVDRAFSRHMPGELIMWHILKWGAENGYKRYDFGGAGKPNEEYGVREFKAKFGGKLVNYGRNNHIHKPSLFAISKVGYQLYRHLFLSTSIF